MMAALVVLGATSCSSSKDGPRTDRPCTWPSTSTPSSRGIALGLTRFSYNHLLAFDTRTGALVGDCATTDTDQAAMLAAYPARFDAGKHTAVTRGLQYLMPPVAGSRITAMPDNTATTDSAGESTVDQGGVRDLHTGAHRALRFAGWLVASVIGKRLLLARYDQYSIPTDPRRWCLLPDAEAARSACVPVPDAHDAGMPSVSPAGVVGWTPSAGRPLRVGAASGYAATDGRTGISGWALPSGEGQIVSADRHTVVFPHGVPNPGWPGNLSWANVRVAGAAMTATLQKSAYRDLHSAAGILLDAGSMAGAFGAGDGLLVAESDGRVYRFDGGTEPRLVTRLRLPAGKAGFALGYLLTWPTDRNQT